MDCDDNDFQNQNFQLIGEDNDGFPQSLQPYDPPKFEIEDHFHSHLRFDTLAETGLFLGIQGEENNWIEEFSPRNSAVDFGSGASQTCSISVHDNLWSNAPSSESSQMLVKSVGDDEINPRVMNTGEEAHAIEDSSRNETKGIPHTDSTHSPGKLHNSSFRSNDVVVRTEEHVVSAETSEAILEVSSLEQKIHPAGKVVASQLNAAEELTSSSSGVSKACLVSGELLDVIQRKEPLDNSSTRNSSLDDCGFTVDKGAELSSDILSCNSQDDNLLPSTENTGVGTGKDNLPFTEQNMEKDYEVDMNERSEALQSENKLRKPSSNLYDDCKLKDHHFQDEALNSRVCAMKDSSDSDPPIDSLILPNEGVSSTAFLKSSDGLLEAIAYPIKVLNKDVKPGDSGSSCINEVHPVAPERDATVERKSVEVGTENNPETCDIAGSKDFDHGTQEGIPKDGLHPPSSSTKNGQSICLGDERDPEASKSVVSDKNSTKLSSSDLEEVALSSRMESETRMTKVEDSNCCLIDPLSSSNFDSVMMEKRAEVECLKSSSKEHTSNFDGSEQAILQEPCATLPVNAENTNSSSTHEKLTPMSETNTLVAELNENMDNAIPLEKENSAQLVHSSETKFESSVGFQNTEVSSSETQNSDTVMDIGKKSLMDQAVAEGVKLPSDNFSTDTEQLQPEVEVIVKEKEVTMSSIPESRSMEKDAQVSYSSVITSSTVTKITVVPDSDANCLSANGLETANMDEVQVDSSPGASSLDTYQSKEDKSVTFAPTNNSDKPKIPETEFDTLSSGRNNLPQSNLLESNNVSCLLEPEGGNLSSYEPSCGSPTVISSNEHTLKEMEHRESHSSLQDPPGPVSETTKNSDSFKGTAQDSKASTASEDDENFTFVVQPDTDISPTESSKKQELFAKTQSLLQPQVPHESSQERHDEALKESTSNIGRSAEDKKKQVSARGTRRASISKVDAKEKSQEKQGRGRKKNPRSSASPAPERATRSKTDTEVVQSCLFGGTNTTKSSSSPNIQTSNLPDLNTSAPLLFHQPFTDLQQVQLRAQIFVYGSLIQGVLPDEACMLPAFGGTDGGRSLWEQAWRAASERFHNQKSPASTSGTHLHYPSEGITCSPLQSKTHSSSAGRRDSKVTVSGIQSSTMTLQSPFQISSNDGLPSNITRGTHLDSNQSLSPMHQYPTSQIRQYLTNSTPWLSPSPHHASWVFSSQSSPFDSTPQYSAIATTEIAQVTPVRDSSKPRATNVQLASPSPSMPNQVAISVSTALAVPVAAQNKEATPVFTKNTSASEKSRKRKKISAPEELLPKFSVSQQAECAPVSFITNSLPNPACLSSQGTVTSVGPVPVVSHTPTMPYYQVLGNGDSQQRAIFSKETFTQIEHSKMQADNASAYAAAAVRHSQVIWEQMAAQRKSGFASEMEEKLASAGVAAAAAASVAKAAAEVAKVASEAALQAKLMADEAINSSNAGNSTQISPFNLDIGKKLLTSTPSVLKGKDKVIGHPFVFAARETTRRRVEAASAAIKRAENLDAILKAAEMAAEAVSQVGTVIAMGDPVPFSINELLALGPGDHWKHHSMTMKDSSGAIAQAKENLGLYVADDHERVTKQGNERPSNRSGRRKNSLVEIPPGNQESLSLQEGYARHELENGSNTIPSDGLTCDPMQGSSIQKGLLVEVVANEGHRGAWFSALVLDVKDGKAYVCYNALLSDEGHDKLKEWIPLESERDQPPRIRIAHRVIEAKPEGIRKRRREAVSNITWSVGDRVDGWMRDGWWEGVITEKSEDGTKLTVHFPAAGESSVLGAWSLRPSLIWKDGQWIEWSRSKERVALEPYQGDTPYGKRQKLGQVDAKSKPVIGEEGTGAASSNIHTDDAGKLEGTKPLNLSAKDVIFSVGKSGDEENNNDTFKVRRAGLQKDGSKVVFGVPKPGKKRKFMEVSKHYTTDKTEKATERSDSLKFAKYLIPQGSQLWRTSSKVDVKGKQPTNLTTKGAKSLRSQNIQAKNTLDKSVTTVSVSNRVESNFRTCSSTQEKKNSLEAASFGHVPGKVDITVVESSMQPVPGIPLSKKKLSSLEAEMGEKEKVSAVDQLSSSEVHGSENPGKRFADMTEPRRSNRRIQPTSRLLEGLQSSLIISKGPGVPQERGAKTSHKGASASRGQSHG